MSDTFKCLTPPCELTAAGIRTTVHTRMHIHLEEECGWLTVQSHSRLMSVECGAHLAGFLISLN